MLASYVDLPGDPVACAPGFDPIPDSRFPFSDSRFPNPVFLMPDPIPLRLATMAMGTRFELVLAGDRAAGEHALELIEDADRRLSIFRRDSDLSRINRYAADGPVRVDNELFELLRTCRRLHRDTGGAFDPTVGPLMEAWGFHGGVWSDRQVGVDAGPPAAGSHRPGSCGFPVAGSHHPGSCGFPAAGSRHPGSWDAARACVGMDLVDLDAGAVRFRKPGVRLDLGGIGKGFALDLAVEALREAGVDSALIHGGASTIVAIGSPPPSPPPPSPPEADGWRIALAPEPDAPHVLLRDAALAVSAPTGRMIERDGQRLGHVMDPAAGRPVEGVSLAAVVAPSATVADAWSTALLVTGTHPEQATSGSPDCRIPIAESRLPNPDSGSPSPDCRIPIAESRLPNPDSRSPDCRLPNPESRDLIATLLAVGSAGGRRWSHAGADIFVFPASEEAP